MAKQPHYTHAIAGEMLGEVQSSAEETSRALRPPDDGADAVQISDAEYRRYFARRSAEDPAFVAAEYDRVAPVALEVPGKPPMRAQAGLRRFIDTVKHARPDVYHAVMGMER